MKRLIADVYRVIYHATRAKTFSLVFSITYISVLNLIALYGLAFLLSAWLPTRGFLKLYNFPYIIITTAAMIVIDTWLMTPLKNLYKERKKEPFYPSIIAYTAMAIILFLYLHYKDMKF